MGYQAGRGRLRGDRETGSEQGREPLASDLNVRKQESFRSVGEMAEERRSSFSCGLQATLDSEGAREKGKDGEKEKKQYLRRYTFWRCML